MTLLYSVVQAVSFRQSENLPAEPLISQMGQLRRERGGEKCPATGLFQEEPGPEPSAQHSV